MSTFAKIVSLLEAENCRYELIEHAPEGDTVVASRIRGHAVRDAAKSLVLEALGGTGAVEKYYLAVVPGDKRVDLRFLRQVVNAKRLQLAPEHVARMLTGCGMGAVPPFSFNEELIVLVDMAIAESNRIFFNAGELHRSIAMEGGDFIRIGRARTGYYAMDNISTEVRCPPSVVDEARDVQSA